MPNHSEPSEQAIQFNEKYQSTLSPNTQSLFCGHFELTMAEVPITSTTKQMEDSESRDYFPSVVDPVTPPTESSCSKETHDTSNKRSTESFHKEKSQIVDSDTQITTGIKPDFQIVEFTKQESTSESNLAIDECKSAQHQVKFEDHPVTQMSHSNDTAGTSSLMSCSKMDDVVAFVSDKLSEDSLDSRRQDNYKTENAISIQDHRHVLNVGASGMTISNQEPNSDEARFKPDHDLLLEENNVCLEEIKHLDITEINQNNDTFEISSMMPLHKIEDSQAMQKEDMTTIDQDSTSSQDLDLKIYLTAEYPQSISSETVQSNQDHISDEHRSDLGQSGSDQSSLVEHQESFDENEKDLDLLIQTSQTDKSAAEILSIVSFSMMHTGQTKQEESLSRKCNEDYSADVFEMCDNKPFEDLSSSQDVSVSATVNAIDIRASSMAASDASRFFGFEELLPMTVESPVKAKNSLHHSEELMTLEIFETRKSLDAEHTLSPSKDEYCIPPGYDEVSDSFQDNPIPTKAASPIFEFSDTEAYFDCKQGTSDFSETESEEPEVKSGSHQQFCSLLLPLPSGSEDYEDSPFTHETLYHVQEEKEESSDEEFSLCEAPPKLTVCEIGAKNSDEDDTNESISREIEAELGTLSESSDEEFLTTRIIRRRVIIKADEMDDIPPQSTSEETYVDENGHIVVKKVTRKVIRKCASSSDGAELEQVSSEAGAHSIWPSKGDGYSKVIKRTIVKSDGDQSEVTFTKFEGLSKQDQAEGGKVSCVENTVVLEGERTMAHHGDMTLASDVPSAQDDFRQALGYIGGFNDTELPHVVERQTVKDDGTLVRRAQMRKGRTLRRIVVKGADQKKQVLMERVEGPRKGLRSTDLKQHLHQLFHHYYEQKQGKDTKKEEEE